LERAITGWKISGLRVSGWKVTGLPAVALAQAGWGKSTGRDFYFLKFFVLKKFNLQYARIGLQQVLCIRKILKIFPFLCRTSLNRPFMQRLVIPVDESIALTWQRAAPEQRARIISLFCWLVEKEVLKNMTSQTFSKLLDDLSEKAVANGLTPEILEEILHES